MEQARVRRTYHGVDAVDAALDELELRERLDEPDPGYAGSGDYDLSWARQRLAEQVSRRASTPDEALEEFAAEFGHEAPVIDDEYGDY